MFWQRLLASFGKRSGASEAPTAPGDAETEAALDREFRLLSGRGLMAPLGGDAASALAGPGGIEAAASTKYGGFMLGAQSTENYLLATSSDTETLLAAVCQGNQKHTSTMIAGALAFSELYGAFTTREAGQNLTASIQRATEAANRRIQRAGEDIRHLRTWAFGSCFTSKVSDLRGIGTSVTVAALHERKLAVGHVGECSAYLFRSPALERLSADHTLGGQPNFEQMRREKPELADFQSDIVMHGLGLTETTQLELRELELKDGDILVLGSSFLAKLDLKRLLQEHTAASAAELCRLLTERTPLDDRPDLAATYVVIKLPGPVT
jgi:protein phosphatase